MALVIPYILMEGVYAGIIGTISAATMGTYSVAKSICKHQNPDINKVINELDLIRRLKLIESVLNIKEMNRRPELAPMKLNELEKTTIFEIVKAENDICDDPIELCLHYLYEIIHEMHNNLLAISKKVAYHKTKWFYTWRTLNIKDQLNTLKISSDKLEARFNDLIKISKFLAEQRGQ